MLKHVGKMTGLTALAVALSVGSVAQAAPVLAGDDMAFAFAAPVAADGAQVLSQGEMQATEGAFLINPIVIGALLSAGAYQATTYYATGNFGSLNGTLIAAGAGALGGAYTGAMLTGFGIPTGMFSGAAWSGTAGVANATVRTNGLFLGQSWFGAHNLGSSMSNQAPITAPTPVVSQPTQPSTRPTTSVTTSTRPTTSVTTSSSSINYRPPVIVNNNDNRWVIQSANNQLNQNYASIIRPDRFVQTINRINACGGGCMTIYGH